MTRTALVLCGAFSVAVFTAGAGCSDSETTTNASGGNTTTNGGSGGTTTNGGGGTGGTSDGGSDGGAGGACTQCGEFILSIGGGAMFDDLCGFQSFDMMTGMFTCDAGSSCELFSDFFGCACGPSCGAACGDNACMGGAPSADCIACTDVQCTAEGNACGMDN